MRKHISARAALAAAVLIPLALFAAGTIMMAGKSRTQEETAQADRWTYPAGARGPGQARDLPVLVEFGDFQCPYCARFALGVLPHIKNDLVRTGTIRFQYRHYAFLGPESERAAEASECARDQGRFDRYHDILYQLTAKGVPLSQQNLMDAAEDTGLEMERFQQCAQERTHRNRVRADREYGRELGVRGTPSLFLDGQALRWNSYRDLASQLRQRASPQ